MGWLDVATGRQASSWDNGMVRPQSGTAIGAPVGGVGTQVGMDGSVTAPVDLSRLYTGNMGSINPNAPPIFRASDFQYNELWRQGGVQRDEQGNPIGAQSDYWSTNLGGMDSGNWQFTGTQDANQFGLQFKDSAGTGMQFQYQRQVGPDGQEYFVPVGEGTRMQMTTNRYGQDVWVPLAMYAAGVGGALASGAGAAGAGAGEVGAAGGATGGGATAATGGGAGATAATGGGVAGSGGLGSATATSGMAEAATPLVSGGGSSAASGLSSLFGGSGSSWAPWLNALLGVAGSQYAAHQQREASRDATNLQRDIYNQNRADLAPWRETGAAGLEQLARLLGVGPNDGSADFGSLMRDFSMQDYQEDPGYQFRLQQGEAAINRNAAARGRYNSGATLKALQDYNSGLASQEYGNAFNRFQAQRGTRLNALQSLAGVGQSATNQTVGAAQNFGNNAASNILGAGNASAAGTIGSVNAINSGFGNWYNMNQSQEMLNALRAGRGM